MKKLLYLIPCLMFALTSCEMFEFDNFDGHDAKVHGAFIDKATNEPVQMEFYATVSSSWWGTTTTPAAAIMRVTETGWDSESVQEWYVKYTGKYQNDLVWAGDYKLDYSKMNVYNESGVTFSLKKGDNEVNFQVTPYCRIKDEVITYDAAAKKFKATFKVELGDASKPNNGVNVMFSANTNNFVGSNFNLCNADPGAKLTKVTPGETITLYLDANPAGVNKTEFEYNRPHYLRICAVVTGSENPNNLYNYSPVYVATPAEGTANNYSIAEYVWEE